MPEVTKLRFYAVRVGVSVLVGGLTFLLLIPVAAKVLRPAFLDYALRNLSDEDRRELYDRIAARSQGLWDTVPEPLVSRIAKRNLTIEEYQADVVTNNAGMRSKKPYQAKAPEVFRIVCLGDSFVFGTGGREEDRFCDQMSHFYSDHQIRVDGRSLETYALGVSGWNAVQEASYLSSRITAYDPDVIVVLTVENDLMDSYGVTGSGGLTTDFSPEYRDRGSAFFSSQAGSDFGVWDPTAFSTDLGPESKARWTKVMAHLKRLTDLQHRRQKKILHSVLRYADPYFQELYKHYFNLSAVGAPMLVTSFLYGRETQLPHDSHPSRLGHSILASHYIHALDALDWVPVPTSQLPELHEALDLNFNAPSDPKTLQAERQEFVDRYLRTSIDFSRLKPDDTRSFLGGIFPDRVGMEGLADPPWASVRSGFLLRRPDADAHKVAIQLGIIPLVELFPLEIRLFIDGTLAQAFRFDQPRASGIYDLSASIPPGVPAERPAVEIILETDSYSTWIEDHRMKSFRLLSARLQ